MSAGQAVTTDVSTLQTLGLKMVVREVGRGV